MRLMALVMMILGLMASGSAKADSQVCGMVIELSATESFVLVTVKTKEGKKVLGGLDNQTYGTASASKLATNTNIVNLATAAMNNPGSLIFCAAVNDKKQILTASIVNKFVK